MGEGSGPGFTSGPRDECAVVGVYAPGRPVGRIALAGLIELNHRGQESSGIAAAGPGGIEVAKGRGVSEVVFAFDQHVPEPEGAVLAVGHNRYSTSGALCDAQPLEFNGLILAHNGNLTNAADLRAQHPPPSVNGERPLSDSAVALQVLAASEGPTQAERLLAGLHRLQGAYAFVLATKDALYGARDPHGFRPLMLGRVEGGEANDGWVLASETAAFPRMGAVTVREVMPGEMVEIDATGVRSHLLSPLSPAEPARCIFELVYVSRPDSIVFGTSVELFRRRTGAMLARKAPVDADVVMPVPRSGISAAIGYAASPEAKARGMTYEQGLLTNAYSGMTTGFRTFIQPTARDAAAVMKYSVVEAVVRDRDLVVVDDSVVRGSFRHIAEKLRAAGARSIHLRVASPPLQGGCYYGVDFGKGELLAHRIPDQAERAKYLGVDSLVHLTWKELVEAAVNAPQSGQEHDARLFSSNGFCGACFTRSYPTDVGGVIPKDDIELVSAGGAVQRPTNGGQRRR